MSGKALASAGTTHDRGVLLRPEAQADEAGIARLISAAFGQGRHQRSVRHLRLSAPVRALSFVIERDGILIGSIRFWPIMVAGKVQLLLGPLAVDPAHKGQGHGKALVAHALAQAEKLPYDFVLISGEPDYYPRFGFVPASHKTFLWPGYIEPERLQIKWLDEAAKKRFDDLSADAPLAILPMA